MINLDSNIIYKVLKEGIMTLPDNPRPKDGVNIGFNKNNTINITGSININDNIICFTKRYTVSNQGDLVNIIFSNCEEKFDNENQLKIIGFKKNSINTKEYIEIKNYEYISYIVNPIETIIIPEGYDYICFICNSEDIFSRLNIDIYFRKKYIDKSSLPEISLNLYNESYEVVDLYGNNISNNWTGKHVLEDGVSKIRLFKDDDVDDFTIPAFVRKDGNIYKVTGIKLSTLSSDGLSVLSGYNKLKKIHVDLVKSELKSIVIITKNSNIDIDYNGLVKLETLEYDGYQGDTIDIGYAPELKRLILINGRIDTLNLKYLNKLNTVFLENNELYDITLPDHLYNRKAYLYGIHDFGTHTDNICGDTINDSEVFIGGQKNGKWYMDNEGISPFEKQTVILKNTKLYSDACIVEIALNLGNEKIYKKDGVIPINLEGNHNFTIFSYFNNTILKLKNQTYYTTSYIDLKQYQSLLENMDYIEQVKNYSSISYTDEITELEMIKPEYKYTKRGIAKIVAIWYSSDINKLDAKYININSYELKILNIFNASLNDIFIDKNCINIRYINIKDCNDLNIMNFSKENYTDNLEYISIINMREVYIKNTYKKLKVLRLSNLSLFNLDINDMINLEKIIIENIYKSSNINITLTKNINLKYIKINNNDLNLSDIDISEYCKNLNYIDCNNTLTSNLHLNDSYNLNYIDCHNCKINELYLKNCGSLETLISYGNLLKNIVLPYNGKIINGLKSDKSGVGKQDGVWYDYNVNDDTYIEVEDTIHMEGQYLVNRKPIVFEEAVLII